MPGPTSIARTAVGRLLVRRAQRSGARFGLVLMYHEIAPVQGTMDDLLPALGRDLFRQQLEHLKRHCEVVPLRELVARAEARAPGDRIPVAITFDDDLSRHATIAAPLLAEFGFPATFFLCGATLDGPAPFWWQSLQVIQNRGQAAWDEMRRELAAVWPWAALDGRRSDLTNTLEAAPPELHDAVSTRLREIAGDEILDEGLSPAAVRELAQSGFEIGFHTLRHYRLETLAGDALDKAMREGFDELAEAAGVRPTSIAYPHGKADLRIADAAQRAGFERGYVVGDIPTTAQQHPLLLARVGGATDSLPIFKWVLGRASSLA
jgi:peptidoglycan/xylan/chitin deacetylase (PgdA/CDA1 family)